MTTIGKIPVKIFGQVGDSEMIELGVIEVDVRAGAPELADGFNEIATAVRVNLRNDGPQRVDPAGCGCTDCLTGYSVPIGTADQLTLLAVQQGLIADSSSTTPEQFESYLQKATP